MCKIDAYKFCIWTYQKLEDSEVRTVLKSSKPKEANLNFSRASEVKAKKSQGESQVWQVWRMHGKCDMGNMDQSKSLI